MLKQELWELCLLHLLSREDLYGYVLLRKLHEAFPEIQESALYAVLRKLSQKGCARTYTGAVSGGPSRKYYQITPEGRERLAVLLAAWRSLAGALASLGIG